MKSQSFETKDDEVTVCIPTLNESESIGEVVNDIRRKGYEPLIIDGGSTDGTKGIAKEQGGVVVEQTYTGGKGAAVLEVIDNIDEGVLVLLDGDCTYEPEHIDRMVELVTQEGFQQVIGNRFSDMEEGSMSSSHLFGNKCANLAFRLIIGKYLVDILSGFRAIDLQSFNSEDIQSKGFDIETELCAYSVSRNHNIRIMDTSYYERKGESKLGEISDTMKILKRMVSCRNRMDFENAR